MMKKLLVGSTVISIAILSVASVGQELSQVTQARWGADTIVRWIITLISLLLASYLAFMNRTDKMQSKVIEVQRQELMALDGQNKRFKEELIQKDREAIEQRSQIEILKVKTDITEVMKIIQEFQKVGDTRYYEAMEQLKKGAEENKSRMDQNYEILNRLLKLVDERWKAA